jgi:hypothetical protein
VVVDAIRSRRLQRALECWAAAAFAIALWDLASDGFYFRVFGIRVSSWEAHKPFLHAVTAGSLALWLRDRDADVASWRSMPRWSRRGAAIAAAASIFIAVHFGIFAAAAADAYGYVSQAALWASRHLTVPEPLARMVPTLGGSVAPLGYRLATTPGSIVPTYASGFPLLMALASAIAGPSAVYYVVPVCSGMLVWLTYLLADRIAGPRTAIIAALLVACSPIVLFQSFEPMSDIPAAMWWAAAWLLALSGGRAAAPAAGLLTSAAILTRPNLAPLALVLAIAVMTRHPRIERGAWFALGVIPGCLAVAAINRMLYGSPLTSGYGSLGGLFAWSQLWTNVRRYPVWLLQLHSPIIFLGLVAPRVTRSEPEASTTTAETRGRSALMIAFAGALLLCYVFYLPFDSWTYVRFLLPAIPLLLILAASVIVTTVSRLPEHFRGATIVLVCALLAGWYVYRAQRLGIFKVAAGERRCVAVGEYLRYALPENGVVVSLLQSGSLRFYGHRSTVRWDWLDPDRLDEVLEILRAAGYVPYILLEDHEEREFRERFGRHSAVGRIDWPASMTYYGVVEVHVYSPDDRIRYMRGERILTRAIPGG